MNTQIDIRALARFMSQKSVFDFVNAATDDNDRKTRIEQMRTKFLAVGNTGGNFSGVAFAAVEDSGNPEMTDYSIYDDCQTFADFNTKAREQVAFGRIKSLVANSNVQKSLKEWILKKNNIVKRNRAAKLEAQKSFSNR